jgi:hypothetical protein
MYQPKLEIGDEVYSAEYGIENAIVCGLKVYFEQNYKLNMLLPMTLDKWLDNTNNCDYDIMYEDLNGVLVRDCFSERYLERYE